MKGLRIFSKKQKNHSSLADYAKSCGYTTQRELARSLGISESLLSHIKANRRSLGKKTALRISRKTGIPLENLIQ